MEIKNFENRKPYWHTTSHILAQAIMRLYPKTKLWVGPPIEAGFYYDFDLESPIGQEDLKKIEKEMKKIIKQNYELERFTLPAEEGIKLMEEQNQPYKADLIRGIAEKGQEAVFRRQGEFVELCSGEHLSSTGEVKAFKLLNVTGAYLHGDSKNKMLTRIYGISFPSAEELESYLNSIEEAKKRDHRKLGKELGLFTFMEEGPGFPFFLPKGCILRNELESYWRKVHKEAGYDEIKTPIILSDELWKQSGHWDHYKDNMYSTQIDERGFAVKPMNCPGAILVYKSQPHSYKELPLKYAEMGLVHRHENSGNLHGLMRVRCFTQDDAHIFIMPSQIESEVAKIINLIDTVYTKMGFEYFVELSTRPENSMGSDEDWENATLSLKKALDKDNISYKINEGDGAFYGPKIDFHLKDCLGRTWQCGTIQLDFQMPERFDLSYIGQDGQKHRPVMLHRVVLGSMERFIGILTEHTMAKFPLWLAPVQVEILLISDSQIPYAEAIKNKLLERNYRVQIDKSSNTFGKKIRDAALRKAPYVLIIGEKEMAENLVMVKNRDTDEQKQMSIEKFIEILGNANE